MRRTLLGLGALAAVLPVALLAPLSTSSGPLPAGALTGEIPTDMLAAYLDAGDIYELDWALLAAIGKLECDHGRSRLPGCAPPGSVNHAGARGPMQFLGSTWRADAGRHDPDVAGPPPPPGRGYGTDGDGDGIADPWNTLDAVHSAARYLVDLGGRDDPRRAAKHYNAGPHNPNPTAGEGYATRVTELIGRYHQLAATPEPATPIGRSPAGGCSLVDPTGTGGCVTPRTAHLVKQLEARFGPLPMWCWAPRPANPTSDHPAGRACDITIGEIGRYPTPSERDRGWTITRWTIDNSRALGLAYIIFDGRIYSPGSGWRTYTGGGVYNPNHPTGGHYDHIHISVRRDP
jgi:hypothetical protein